uniref:Uncharacterized protein n=1 Tax=Anguilla anguilla TaxID=7936 RepID=A0A0E9RBD2_ANGAN
MLLSHLREQHITRTPLPLFPTPCLPPTPMSTHAQTVQPAMIRNNRTQNLSISG